MNTPATDEISRAVRGLQALRTVLGIDSPETRGWAPVVQQESRRAIDRAIAALTPTPAQPDEFERGRQQGMKQERALWQLAAEGQKIEADPPTLTDAQCDAIQEAVWVFEMSSNAVGSEEMRAIIRAAVAKPPTT